MILKRKHGITFLSAGGVAGQPVTDYVQRFFGSHPGHDKLAGELREQGEFKPGSLPLVDREAVLKRLSPEAIETLKTEERWLLQTIAREWHLPPDEHVIRCEVGALAAQVEDYPAGTIVVIRETNAATLAFILGAYGVDIATGAIRNQDIPALPGAAPARTPRVRAAAPLNVTPLEGGHLALELAATLSFALPAPFGPVVAGVLGLFNALIPQDKSALPQQIVDALVAAEKQRDLGKWLTESSALMRWCQEKLSAMSVTDPATEQVKNDILPGLENDLNPGGETLYTHLESMFGSQYINEPGAFNILVTCVSVYLFGLRFKLTLEAWLASKAKEESDAAAFNTWNQAWRYDYIVYQNAVIGTDPAGWAVRLGQLIDQRIADRMGQITPVARKTWTSSGSFCNIHTGTCNTETHYSWAFSDLKYGDNWNEHSFEDTPADNKNDADVQHQAEAEQARTAYVGKISQEVDDEYGGAKKTVRAWVDAINSWKEHLPPSAPKSAPEVPEDGWKESAGKGIWAEPGAKVQYAVSFKNDKGPSPIGPWSDAAETKGRAKPTVKIPTDPTDMTDQRWVYRKFSSDTTTTPVETLHKLIPDRTTTSFEDDQ